MPRSNSIDSGLARLRAEQLATDRPELRTYTHREIAAACGCSHVAIINIERKAMKSALRKLQSVLAE